MEIANPIYDVVFKYLLEDNKVAKILLSALTNLDIVELSFLPQELSNFKDEKGSPRASVFNLSIYRLDFSAKIRDNNGEYRLIIIEVQKSKFTHETMRFRKYLGKQYMDESMFEWVEDANRQKYKAGIPILPIYFLGEEFKDFSNYPVLKIAKTVKDRYSNEVISSKLHFVESLFHEGIIINIPALKQKRRDELEILLSIFDQDQRTQSNHIMNVKETDFPEKFRPIIRRLQGATQEKEVRDIMIIEDDFMSELNDYENRINELRQQAEEAHAINESERELTKMERAQKEEERAQKEEERAQKEEERAQKEEERAQKEEEIELKENAIKLLSEMGMTAKDISQKLNISESDIIRITRE